MISPARLTGSSRPLKSIARSLLSLLYPPSCALCEAELPQWDGQVCLCSACRAVLPRLVAPWCERCGEPLEGDWADLCARCAGGELPFERLRSFGSYQGNLAELIRAFKFGGERALAGELADYLLELAAHDPQISGAQAITFVPMTARARRARGFNQTELLARRLGRRLELPVIKVLAKLRETRLQVELGGRERRENLSGAFAARHDPRYEKILLIDDVYTTGATLAECSQALAIAGYSQIYALTLARTVFKPRDDQDN